MKTSKLLLAVLVLAASVRAEKSSVFPPGVKPVGPYSPGILAGDSLYVAGQGAQKADGTFPETPEAQLRQCLENVRTVVEAAGLTMDHVVYAQVYVKDPHAFDAVDHAWSAYFSKNGPARSMIGVGALPQNTPVEVNAVAVRKLSDKRPVSVAGGLSAGVPAAVFGGERLYISDCRGENTADALARMGQVLQGAHLDFANMVFVNPYLTDKVSYEEMNRDYATHFEFGNTPARATIQVASLPAGAHIEFTGVAVSKLSKRRAVRPKNMEPSPTASPCVFAGGVFYCSAKSGFIPGPNSGIYASTVEEQVRQTMRNLLDGLEEAGLNFSNVVAANVYLDDVADFPKMNGIYKLFFDATPPARTTVQQYPAGERKPNAKGQWPTLEQISLVAVKE
ncbi:MAG TPA: RidA family protein [Bryobacteraceae bacterium]|jgi:reactive intermediate/imine deaminase|nr:RidA family protein [Bryobacteraceae bacterium]